TPGYREAKTTEEKLEVIHRNVLCLLEAMHVDLPAYHKAKNAEEQAKALLHWLGDQEGYLLKPMNCPHHIQIYKAEQRSYRDLPVRLAEFGTVYRYEQTGELNGMTLVRGFTQDDAHLFITPEQFESADHDPPCPVRFDGALHGHPDRAFRRRLPNLAGAGASSRADREREVHRLCPQGRSGVEGARLPRRRGLSPGKDWLQNSRG